MLKIAQHRGLGLGIEKFCLCNKTFIK